MQTKHLFQAATLFTAMAFMAVQPASAEEIKLTGSGASFPAPLYTTWFKEFSRAHNDIQVNYQSKGSGAGIKDFLNHTVDFAASDAAMTDEEIAKVPEGVQLLPMTAGEIVLSYNLPGVKDIKLSREAYPSIFMGKIKKWNDPAIAASNPGVTLPDQEITVVVRADSSGTNFVFTKHLSAISPEFSKSLGFGTTVNWPADAKIVKAPKNDGVSATLKQTPGAIGYVEFGFAREAKLDMVSLQNKAGKFVAPGLEGGQEALSKAEIPANMIAWLPDPDGDKSYPIATYTWMAFYKKNSSHEKAEALRKMVIYGLDEGQEIADKAGYIPLPKNVIEKVRAASANIQ